MWGIEKRAKRQARRMSKKTPRIVVVGSTNIDLTFRVDRLPRLGETFAGTGFQMGFGGKGANQAVMAARLGAQVAMVSKVGRDAFGEQALENFRSQGIDTTHVSCANGHPTGTAGIFVDNKGRNAIIVVSGANAALTPADVRKAAVVIRGADVLLCQLEVPLATTLAAFQLAKKAKVYTILNPAPAHCLPEELLGLTDLCVPNESELELLEGKTGTNRAGIEAAARRLMGQGPKSALITLGERGWLLVTGKEMHHGPAEAVQAVDTSGAGDAFLGCWRCT